MVRELVPVFQKLNVVYLNVTLALIFSHIAKYAHNRIFSVNITYCFVSTAYSVLGDELYLFVSVCDRNVDIAKEKDKCLNIVSHNTT